MRNKEIHQTIPRYPERVRGQSPSGLDELKTTDGDAVVGARPDFVTHVSGADGAPRGAAPPEDLDAGGSASGADTVGEPWLLTVEQAAHLLQIGRTLAYELVGRFETSGGVEGIPVVRIGGTLRVPRDKLADQILSGLVSGSSRGRDAVGARRRPASEGASTVAAGERGAVPLGVRSSPRRRRSAGSAGSVQPPLFGAG